MKSRLNSSFGCSSSAALLFFFLSSLYFISIISSVSASRSLLAEKAYDGNYYYNYYYTDNPNQNQTTPACSEQCSDFGNNSAACLKSCSTCGFDVTVNDCIFIAVGSWGCPDGGDNVILGISVSNSCSNDALTACDQATAGFFLANCVSGGVYFFTFWSFVWVARSSGRFGPLLKWTVICGLGNIVAFIPVAVVLYVYAYCTAAKVVFIVHGVISLICWLLTLFRACGWFPLNSTDDIDNDISSEEKATEMTTAATRKPGDRPVQLKQIQVVKSRDEMHTSIIPAVEGDGEVATGEGVAPMTNAATGAHFAEERKSNSSSHSNPLSDHNLSLHSSPPTAAREAPVVNMPLDADGNTPPQFTAAMG